MRHGSLFSGIGGFDLAAEWMGWENVFHCEWNPFGQKILKHYWPNAKSYGDITKTDFTEWRGKVDIVSGGFPCQPYSTAGKRKGKADDRHLWPEMLRAIREIQPRWVVGENVPGLLNWQRGMVLDEIKADLEATGFEVFPSLVLPACGKNAPHRRDRLWIVAHTKSDISGHEFRNERHNTRKVSEKRFDEPITTANTCGIRCNTRGAEQSLQGVGEYGKAQSDVTNTHSNGQQWSNSKHEINTSERRFNALNDIKPAFASNSNSGGLQREPIDGIISSVGEKRDEQFAINVSSAWQKFPTEPPICGRNDGVPNRVDRIKALGNAIVPQVAYEIFKAIEEFERRTNHTT